MIELGNTSKIHAAALRQMCAEDILFFINTFAWIYEPRASFYNNSSTVLPFLTWDRQDEVFLQLQANLGKKDTIILKSRETGVSWIALCVMAHDFIFSPTPVNFICASRKAAFVDSKNNPSALFPKLDFLFDYLPKWILDPVDIDRSEFHIYNRKNKSSFFGETTSKNLATGGRCKAILLDEFAALGEEKNMDYDANTATRDVAGSRFFVSTPKGAKGCFHEIWSDSEHYDPEHIDRIIMHWKDDTRKNKGLYKVLGNGEIKIIDHAYHDKHPNYKFITDAPQNEYGVRSVWYDKECKNRFKFDVAQELDCSFIGSGHRFFDDEVKIQELLEKCREPLYVGDFVHEYGYGGKFMPIANGRLKLWCNLTPTGMPVFSGEAIEGVDIAAGTGQSNSVISIADKKTGEKLAEYVNSMILPENLAELAFALANWFGGAFIKHDAYGGGGATFTKRMIELEYTNMYFRKDDTKIKARVSDNPGFFMKGSAKVSLLSDYRDTLARGAFVNYSEPAIKELRDYFYDGTTVEHKDSMGADDPSGAGANHGDCVIADALCASCLDLSSLRSAQKKEERESIDEWLAHFTKAEGTDNRMRWLKRKRTAPVRWLKR